MVNGIGKGKGRSCLLGDILFVGLEVCWIDYMAMWASRLLTVAMGLETVETKARAVGVHAGYSFGCGEMKIIIDGLLKRSGYLTNCR